MDKNNRLDDQSLDNVSGGYLFNSSNIIGADKDRPWEIIDDKGDVKGRFSDYGEACRNAKAMGLTDDAIGWDEVQRRRQQNGR